MLDNVDNYEGVKRNNKELAKDESKCPFKKNFEKIQEDKNELKADRIENKIAEGLDLSVTQNRSITKCPYNLLVNNSATLNETKHDTSSDENEENVASGCPMLNKVRKESEEIFSFSYEIPYESPYDFIFKTRGTMNKADFLQKTTKLRSMPRHLRFSLFYLKEEKLVNLKKKEFPDVYFAYEELREKAYKHYSRKESKQAIKHYILTYSLFKWLEFKVDTRDKDILNSQSDSLPILDDDIQEKRLEFNKDESDMSNFEEGCYKTCLTTILKHLSLCYMHLRHFSEAIVCLNESINYSNNKVPELYLRRSQARTYNKFSNMEQLNLALKDINKAIELVENEPRFLMHLKILKDLIEEKSSKEIERTEKLIHNAKYSFHKINEKKLNLNDYVYSSYDHIETNSKVLDEMLDKYKNTFKFHNETNNQKQLTLAYKEIEEFSDIYYKFKWYYMFDLNNISEHVSKCLSYEDKNLLKHTDFQRLIQDYKYKTCEDIFSKAKFNFKMFSYALERVLEEEKIRKEINKKYSVENYRKSWNFDFTSVKNKAGLMTLSTILVCISMIFIIYHFYLYNDKTKRNV